MSNQKMSKSLPKRVMNTHAKEYRKTAWANGQARKVQRRKLQDVQAATNAAAGNTPKRQTRKRRADNMHLCLRCRRRQIVAGSVCWCATVGATRYDPGRQQWVIV